MLKHKKRAPMFPGGSVVKNLVFLLGKSHGQRNLAGYIPWGHKESDMTEKLRPAPFTCFLNWVSFALLYIANIFSQIVPSFSFSNSVFDKAVI